MVHWLVVNVEDHICETSDLMNPESMGFRYLGSIWAIWAIIFFVYVMTYNKTQPLDVPFCREPRSAAS